MNGARRPARWLRWLALAAPIVVVVGLVVFWIVTIPATVPASALPAYTPNVANGKTMFDAGGCASCHAVPNKDPDKVDRLRLGGGLALPCPFGTFYVPNISPDPKDGIGSWSEADFVSALWNGTAPGGEHLYPAFPYAAYTYLTDDDVLAIKAYLFTQPAVKNTAPPNELGFPFNQRWLMGIWAAMYDPNKRFEPHPDHSPEWNRGAYLVEALGHCGDCHTPRTPFQSLDNRHKFAGGSSEGLRGLNGWSRRVR